MVSGEDTVYDRLYIRRVPLLVGLVIVFSLLLIVSGQGTPAYAGERFTGQKQVRFEQSVVRQEMTPTISIASGDTYVAGLGTLTFTLTRGGDVTDSLDVSVEIEQDQTWLSTTTYTVTFEADENEAELENFCIGFLNGCDGERRPDGLCRRGKRLRCVGCRGDCECHLPGGSRP